MWSSKFKSVLIGVGSAAAVIAITGAASGSGIGAVFNLGRTNKVNAETTLKGATKRPMLSVSDTSTGPALNLQVAKGKAPLRVNSSTQVANLNASLLGGLAASQFVKGGGKSLSFGFSEPTSPESALPLLSVPGFGTFDTVCGANNGTAFADVSFLTDSHAMDKFTAALTSGSDVAVGDVSLAPNTKFAIADTQSPGVSAIWEQVTFRYATGSGHSLTEHTATIDVTVAVTATTCDYNASAIIEAGATGP